MNSSLIWSDYPRPHLLSDFQMFLQGLSGPAGSPGHLWRGEGHRPLEVLHVRTISVRRDPQTQAGLEGQSSGLLRQQHRNGVCTPRPRFCSSLEMRADVVWCSSSFLPPDLCCRKLTGFTPPSPLTSADPSGCSRSLTASPQVRSRRSFCDVSSSLGSCLPSPPSSPPRHPPPSLESKNNLFVLGQGTWCSEI